MTSLTPASGPDTVGNPQKRFYARDSTALCGAACGSLEQGKATVNSEEPSGQASISIFKSLDQSGHPCVALIVSQSAFVETVDTHEPYPGVALSPQAALQVVEEIQAVLREIETGSV